MPDTAKVTGRCPACRGDSLHVMDGGHITCSRLDCPNPAAVDDLLVGPATHAVEHLVEYYNQNGFPIPLRYECESRAAADATAALIEREGKLRVRVLRRAVAYGPWEPAPAETSAEGERPCAICTEGTPEDEQAPDPPTGGVWCRSCAHDSRIEAEETGRG